MERLDERLFLNLSARDKDRLRQAAIADGRSLANEARRLILAGLAKAKPSQPAIGNKGAHADA